MTRKIGFSKVSWLGVLAGLLGYFFHATMRSGGSEIPLVAFSVLMALLFWLSAVTLEKKSGQRARLLVQSDAGIRMIPPNAGHKPNTNPSAHECASSAVTTKEHTHGQYPV